MTPPTERSVTVSVRISPDLAAHVDRISKETYLKSAAIYRHSVQQYVDFYEKKKKLRDQMREVQSQPVILPVYPTHTQSELPSGGE